MTHERALELYRIDREVGKVTEESIGPRPGGMPMGGMRYFCVVSFSFGNDVFVAHGTHNRSPLRAKINAYRIARAHAIRHLKGN